MYNISSKRIKIIPLPLVKNYEEQECIQVGCVPPARWPYPSMHWAGVCIPTCTGQQGCVSQHALARGCVSQHALPMGVSARDVWQTPPPPPRTRGRPPPPPTVDRQTPAVIKYVFVVQGEIEEPNELVIRGHWGERRGRLNVHSKLECQTPYQRQRRLSFEFMTPSRENMVSVYSCVTNVLANWAFNGRRRVTVVM